MPVVRVSGLAALAGEERWVASILDLLDAIDAYVPVPERYLDAPFLMAVENCLTITGRGTVVTGAVERGQVRVGDPVELIGLGAAVTVRGHRPGDVRQDDGARAGRRQRGAAAARRRPSPGPARPGARRAGQPRAHRRFTARCTCCPAAEGGRRTPVRSGYSPQFYVRTTDVSGVLDLGGMSCSGGAAAAPAMPGDGACHRRAGQAGRARAGLGFAIREGGRTVGAGTVTALLD